MVPIIGMGKVFFKIWGEFHRGEGGVFLGPLVDPLYFQGSTEADV